MARYTGPVCRLCRREGQKLFLKGERCYSEKCSLNVRAYAPGQHGQGRSKASEYGTQLREKQKAKRYYGVAEKQFRMYFEKADKKAGVTGDNLLSLLERRKYCACGARSEAPHFAFFCVKAGHRSSHFFCRKAGNFIFLIYKLEKRSGSDILEDVCSIEKESQYESRIIAE